MTTKRELRKQFIKAVTEYVDVKEYLGSHKATEQAELNQKLSALRVLMVSLHEKGDSDYVCTMLAKHNFNSSVPQSTL